MGDLTAYFDAPSPSKAAVRDALSDLSDDDVSVSSPISAGGREAAVVVGDNTVIVRVIGHGGEWTKKSTEAVIDAVESAEGVTVVSSVDGGYDANDE